MSEAGTFNANNRVGSVGNVGFEDEDEQLEIELTGICYHLIFIHILLF
jgi:hypothetical protein